MFSWFVFVYLSPFAENELCSISVSPVIVNYKYITFLTVLKLKGILKILHSQRSKAAVKPGKSALWDLFEVISVDNLPTKSLACLKCLWARELSNATNLISNLIFHLGTTSASLPLIQFSSDQFCLRSSGCLLSPLIPSGFKLTFFFFRSCSSMFE